MKSLTNGSIQVVVTVAMLVSIIASSGMITTVQASVPTYTTHAVIHVDNNNQLESVVSSGGGTVSDPYIIQNYNIDATGKGNAIYIGNTTAYVIVRNCILNNATYVSSPYQYGCGITLYHAKNVTVSKSICNGNSYGIYLGTSSDNNTIESNNCSHNTYDGIYLGTSSDNNTIENNTCNSNFIGIYQESSSDNNTIENNTCNGNSYGIRLESSGHNVVENNNCSGNSNGIYLGTSSDNVIENNTCSHNTYDGIYLGTSSDNVIENNTCNGNIQQGIYLYSSNYNVIENNNYSGNGYYSIYLESSNYNVIENNTCNDNSYQGIDLYSSNYNVIENNTCNGNSYYGIDLDSSSNYNVIENNTCNGNIYQGIYLDSSSYNVIENNNCNKNAHHGILMMNSESNNIENNNCSGNTIYGMYLISSSDNNVIENNTCSHNSNYGIYLSFSSNNKIENNTMIDNNGATSTWDAGHVQAYDDSDNTWNNTMMGNYWGDWQTPDANHDGIVDIPYLIDGGSGAEDHFPMVLIVSVKITSPISGSFNNTGSVTVKWTAIGSGSDITKTEISTDGTTWIDVTGNTSDVLTLSDGLYTVYVRATDDFGKVNTTSVTFTVDTIKPALDLLTPVQGSWHNTTSLNATWTATDSGSGMAYYWVRIDTGQWINMTSDHHTFNGLADGQHTLDVRAYDKANNYNVTTGSFNIDTVKPSLNITTPVQGSWHNTTSLNATWTATDSGSGMAYYWVRIDTGQWINMTSDYRVLTGLSDGQHTVEVRAYDVAGNYNETTRSFGVDTVKPTIIIMTPIANELVNYSKIEVSWNASSASGIADYWVSIDGGTWTDVAKNMSFSFDPLADGSHTITVKCEDNAGNVNETTVSFEIDTVAPTITAHSPTGSEVHLNATIGISFSESMNESSVRVIVNGVAGTLAWSGNNVTFIPTALLGYDNTYTINVTGKDLAGNEVEFSWSFTTMKNEGVIEGVIKDASGNPVANATVTLSNGMTTTTDASGHFLFENVTSGTYTMNVTRAGFEPISQSVTTTAGLTSELGTLSMLASPNSSSNDGILYGAAAVLFVALILLLILFARRRKKKE